MEVKINAEPVNQPDKEKKYGKFDEWEINCAVDTLIRAQEIRNDSEKMKYVEPLLKEKLTDVQNALSELPELKKQPSIKGKIKDRLKEME